MNKQIKLTDKEKEELIRGVKEASKKFSFGSRSEAAKKYKSKSKK